MQSSWKEKRGTKICTHFEGVSQERMERRVRPDHNSLEGLGLHLGAVGTQGSVYMGDDTFRSGLRGERWAQSKGYQKTHICGLGSGRETGTKHQHRRQLGRGAPGLACGRWAAARTSVSSWPSGWLVGPWKWEGEEQVWRRVRSSVLGRGSWRCHDAFPVEVGHGSTDVFFAEMAELASPTAVCRTAHPRDLV